MKYFIIFWLKYKCHTWIEMSCCTLSNMVPNMMNDDVIQVHNIHAFISILMSENFVP